MIQEFYMTLISLADITLADIGSTNENSASPDGTACNLRIHLDKVITINNQLRFY